MSAVTVVGVVVVGSRDWPPRNHARFRRRRHRRVGVGDRVRCVPHRCDAVVRRGRLGVFVMRVAGNGVVGLTIAQSDRRSGDQIECRRRHAGGSHLGVFVARSDVALTSATEAVRRGLAVDLAIRSKVGEPTSATAMSECSS